MQENKQHSGKKFINLSRIETEPDKEIDINEYQSKISILIHYV